MKRYQIKWRIWAGGICLASLFGTAIWFLNEPSAIQETPHQLTALNVTPEKRWQPVPEEEPLPSVEPPVTEPPHELVIGPERLRAIARHSYLQILDSESLNISRASVDLLGLNPMEIEGVNVACPEWHY